MAMCVVSANATEAQPRSLFNDCHGVLLNCCLRFAQCPKSARDALAVSPGAQPDQTAKCGSEVRLIRKAAIERDPRDRRVARCQQSLRPLEEQPGAAQIRLFAISLLEYPNDVEGADIGDFREILQGYLFGEVRVHIFANTL